jgi:hypothetical protein
MWQTAYDAHDDGGGHVQRLLPGGCSWHVGYQPRHFLQVRVHRFSHGNLENYIFMNPRIAWLIAT